LLACRLLGALPLATLLPPLLPPTPLLLLLLAVA
jgi:hypothetical protein